MSIINLCHWPS